MNPEHKRNRITIGLFVLVAILVFGLASIVRIKTYTGYQDKKDVSVENTRASTNPNEPNHWKTLTNNRDGTFSLELSVEGAIAPQQSTANANILVVFDVSNSMSNAQSGATIRNVYIRQDTGRYGKYNGSYITLYTKSSNGRYSSITNDTTQGTVYYNDPDQGYKEYTGKRYILMSSTTKGAAAENVVYDFANELFSYNKEQDSRNVEMALITFSSNTSTTNDAHVVQGWTNNKDTYTNYFAHDGSSRKLHYSSGTNWEEALDTALDSVLSTADDDETFVIFITDGAPTQTASNHSTNTNYATNYAAAKQVAYNVNHYNTKTHSVNVQTNNTELYGIYAYGTSNNYLDDLIYYAYNGEEMSGGASGGTEDNVPYFYPAAEQEQVEQAIEDIMVGIVQALGITDVEISDGTTSNVKLTSGQVVDLLTIDDTTFTYWMSKDVYPYTNDPTAEWWVGNDKGYEWYTTRVDRNNADIFYVYTQDLGKDENQVNHLKVSWKRPSDGIDHTVTVVGSIENKQLPDGTEDPTQKIMKVQWKSIDEGGYSPYIFFNQNPPEATVVNGTVDWDLSSVPTLLNGVTYSVKFDVWKTQQVFDLIADLENGIVKYADLDANAVDNDGNPTPYAGLKDYIVEDCNSNNTDCFYRLRTNTTAQLSYKDTREENPQTHTAGYSPPTGIRVYSDEISIHKNWRNYIGDHQEQTEVNVSLLEDDQPYGNEIKLKESNGWSNTETIKIAPGLMKIKYDTDPVSGKQIASSIDVLDPGHDYTFAELDENQYNYQMVSETVHPMVLNGVLTELIKVDTNMTGQFTVEDTPIEDFYVPLEMQQDLSLRYMTSNRGNHFVRLRAGGPVYLITDEVAPAIEAYNYRKSNLNVKKIVDGDSAPENALYKFEIKVNDPNADDDELLYFSVYDNGYIDVLTQNRFDDATGIAKSYTTKSEDMIDSTGWDGYFTVKNNTAFTIQLKASENLRFINLATSTEYTVQEKDVIVDNVSQAESFVFDAEGSIVNGWYYGKTEQTSRYLENSELIYTKNQATKTINGTINYTNTSFNIMMKNTYKLVDVEVTKEWDDDNDYDGIRQNNNINSIDVQLYKKVNGGQRVPDGEVITLTGPDWTYKWTNKPRYDGDLTREITYEVDEILDSTSPIATEYTKTIEDLSTTGKYKYNIKNSHEAAKIDIEGEKTWEDDDDRDGERPGYIWVVLKEQGSDTVLERKQVLAGQDGTWKYKFTGYPKTRNGVDIQYVVEEEPVDFYTPTNNGGFNIKNTHNIFKTGLTITKVWDDNNNQDNIRPQQVSFILKADGVPVQNVNPIVLTASNNWTYSNDNLPRKHNGTDINYTIDEINVTGYSTTYKTLVSYPENSTNILKDNKIVSFEATNKHTPTTISVSGEKTWADDDNRDGTRPDSITVRLLADGVSTGLSKTVTPDTNGDWKYTFENVPEFRSGQVGERVVYTVTEDPVAGYTPQTSGMNITNTHTSEKTSVSGSKTWVDNNDQDGLRPTSITVKLYNGQTKVDEKTVTPDTAGNWNYQFNDLYKYENGTEIQYQVVEDAVTGYTTTYQGNSITNTHSIEKTSISGTKTWDDGNNQDGIRPASVKVNLLANGAYTGKSLDVTENAQGQWLFTFPDLDKYLNGSEVVYTVTENAVPGYSTTISGTNITNTHVPETITVEGTKSWDDSNNNDNVRPGSITVKLLADGVDTGQTATASATNNWKYSFTDLPKYKNGTEITYSVEESPVDYYTPTNNGYNIKNVHSAFQTGIVITKVWSDSDNRDGIRPDSISFIVKANGIPVSTVGTVTLTSSDNWTTTISNLPRKINGVDIVYTVEEISVPGYDLTEQTNTTYPDTNQTINSNKTFTYTATNSHTPEKTSVSGQKIWDDNDNQDGIRPPSVTVNLYADGTYVRSQTVTGPNWTYSFDNLDKYTTGAVGDLIEYTVTEDEVTGYTSTKQGNNFVNKHIPSTVKVEGEKEWQDNNNQDGIRPTDVTINLLVNGNYTGKSQVVSAATNWKYSFTDLPEYLNGNKVTYTVTENLVTGYTLTRDGNKFINTHTPETIKVEGTKVWDDNNNQDGLRQTVTVNLLADGQPTGKTATASFANNWKYEFTNLPKYSNGNEINYTVTENEVTGYTSQVSGTTITNSHTPETTKVEGEKTWSDGNDQDGLRPDSITVNLFANGSFVTSKVVTKDAEGKWKYSFDSLPKKHNGVVISYTVTENPVSGYTTTQDGNNFTNTHTPETVTIEGTKTWNDNNNQDGIRPNSITVKLLADGQDTGKTATANATSNWKYSFTDLPKYSNGTEIAYTVTENPVSGYTPAQQGTNFTNTHVPETTKVEGTKVWSDGDNQDGIRPASVTVNLLANGAYTGQSQTVTGPNWTYSFTNLAKYLNGQEVTYTVTENPVDGYTATVNGTTITNTHTPETTSVSGQKVWDDNNNQDGLRPASVTVNLYNGSTKVDSKTVTGPDWSYSFTNLPKKENGTVINYTVTEDAVANYNTSISGTTITNTHTPQKVKVEGAKVWDDNNDQDGKRPDSITVNLLANGSYTGQSKAVTGPNWTYSFTNLDKYLNGSEITYTVTENQVADYTTTVSGTTITNKHTPETITVEGEKTWADDNDRDKVRPETITVKLLADGTDTGKTSLASATNNWKYSFTGLPKYNNGVEINYTVEENAVDYYTPTNNGYNITNTHSIFNTGIVITKSWDDNNNHDGIRPSQVSFILKANGIVVPTETITLNESNNWTYVNNNLPRKQNGTDIVYTIEEVPVPGYELHTQTVETYQNSTNTTYGNKTFTFSASNKHPDELISIKGQKSWADNNNQDGLRPDNITVTLYADGVATNQTLPVNASNGWKYEFTNLPKYKAGESGVEVVYTVKESPIEGYTPIYDGTNITNTHSPEKTSVSGQKVWNDNNNQDGLRPDSVTVNLLANGAYTGQSKTVTGPNWTYSFTNLDKYLNGSEINYTVTENQVDNYTTTISGTEITNTHTPETTKVEGNKVWNDNNNQDGIRPDSVTVKLLADGTDTGKTTTATATSNWTYSFTNLPKYSNGTEISYTVEEVNVKEGYTASVSGTTITNTHTPETTSISGIKSWSDNNNQDGIRPNSITVNLLANSKAIGRSQTITAADNWQYSFTGLDKYENGVAIVYTVVEDPVTNYTATPTADGIQNSHTPETTKVEGSKVWDDNNNQDGIRPDSITIKLLANGSDTGKTTTASASTNWQYSFTNLPKKANGQDITYTVEEVNVKEGYTVSVSGTTITNSHTTETTEVEVTKVWNDSNDQDGLRPTKITYNLLANGNLVRSQEVTSTNNWSYKFTNLPKKSNGVAITYTITENPVDGYTTTISGNTVTNTHTPATTKVEGEKVWKDSNDQDGLRPDSVTIKLLADGTDTGKTATANAASNWTYSFTNLPKYDNGTEISYTVEEVNVKEGYTASVSGTTITNSHTPEKTSVSGEKVWSDNNNQDGLRPDKVKVNLFANDSLVKSQEVSAATNWQYSFTNLPKYADGVAITYTVTENPVSGYTTEISGTTITNSHTPEMISVSGEKVWSDNNNQDGLRPDSVTIKLYADGVDTGKTTTATSTSNWTYSFTNLPKYSNGTAISYTVEEDAVTGYTTVVSGTTITNTHTPETTKVEGKKVWKDNNNQDGLRTQSIMVKLLADGEVVASKQVTQATNWQYSFTNLPKYSNGTAINYTVEEDAVLGYTTTISGYDITNTHRPETTTITGSKTWDDNNDQDGIRPDSIVISLRANGVKITSQTLHKNSDGSWPQYSFTNLPVYAGGSKINYTVEEDTVGNYSTTVNGLEVTNTHNPFKTEISVQKVWDDDFNRDNARPASITVILKADGVAISDQVVLNTRNEWFKKWTNLNRFANGKEIKYTVEEVVPAGSSYTPEVTVQKATEPGTKSDNSEDYTITNKHEFETVDVSGEKIWNDNNNQDGIRPGEVTVLLKADNNVIDSKVVTSQDNWQYSWTGLPKYQTNAVGYQIKYTVEEETVPAGYTQSVTGYNITNTHDPEKISVSGEKVWKDNNDQDGIRPGEVTIELFADGVAQTTTTATAANNWNYSFNNLPKYKAGHEIGYTVKEQPVTGYSSEVNGTTITNTHTPETTSISGKKVWVDNHDQDGVRPTTITINVKDGDNVVKQVPISGENTVDEWSFTIDGLPKYKDKGTIINYTIDEVLQTDKYVKEVAGMTITNTHLPTTVDVPISKTWIDNSNQESKRPEKISVSLKADGTVVDTIDLTGNTNNWSHTFTGLPKFRDHGTEIKYTVVENSVDSNYDVSYPEDRAIINTIKALEREIPITKVWVDNDNQDGKRPNQLVVNLVGTVKVDGVNKEVHKDSITLEPGEEKNTWKNKFEHVPIFYNGQVISYTVNEELSGDLYPTTSITGNVKDGYTITNSHTPEKTEITATKVWSDSDNNDGLRPTSVTIILNDENGEVTRKTITEADNWQAVFPDLDKYRNGQEINYTVTEEAVEGYTSTIDKTTRTITNTHEPLKITYEINKIWDDFDNQDGKRPDSITVRLYADENEIDSATITPDEYGNWKYTFTDLPKYVNGKLIQYTITEDPVDLYKTEDIKTIENTKPVMDLSNSITNTHALIPYNDTGTITVNKIWVDENDKYNKRPSGITVRLYANGVEFRVATLNAANNWTYTFTDLPKYEPGKVGVEVKYTIKEDQIINYYTKIDNYTIINTYNGPRTQRTEIIPPHTGIETQQDSHLFEILMLIVSLGYTLTISLRTNE